MTLSYQGRTKIQRNVVKNIGEQTIQANNSSFAPSETMHRAEGRGKANLTQSKGLAIIHVTFFILDYWRSNYFGDIYIVLEVLLPAIRA